MKRLACLAALGLLAACGVKKIDAPEVEASAEAQLLERGRYLATHVMSCIDCHSERDWTRNKAPVVDGTWGQGGETWTKDQGLPGTIVAPNITQAALGDWSDAELARSIVNGLDREGRALFPLMPYPSYRVLTRDDLVALVTFLRTLEPIAHETAETELSWPVSALVKRMPTEWTPTDPATLGTSVERGEYLTTIAGCDHCHTPQKRGSPIEGREMGGWTMTLHTGVEVTVPNISPHEDGLGGWSREDFVEAFHQWAEEGADQQPAPADGKNSPMPWLMYAGMSAEDLGAIYDYLMTMAPVPNVDG